MSSQSSLHWQIRDKFSRAPPLPGYGCDGNDNDNINGVDDCGEDKFPPIIHLEEAAAGAEGRWFTTTAKLLAFINKAVHAEDDCYTATLSPPTLTKNCAASIVSLTAEDRCKNQQTATLNVWFDDERPKVTVGLADARQLSSKGGETAPCVTSDQHHMQPRLRTHHLY
jgi:hypothetical protein